MLRQERLDALVACDSSADVGVAAKGDLDTQLGTALGNVVAGQEGLVALLGAREAGLVELHELAEVARCLEYRVKLEVHAGTAEVPEDEHLLVLQRVDVHLGVLRGGLLVGEVVAADARNDVVAVTDDACL